MAFIGTGVETCPEDVKIFSSKLNAFIVAPQMLPTGNLKPFRQLLTVHHYVRNSVTTGLMLVLMI